MTDLLHCEIRESGGEFVGIVLVEGRASRDRRELFVPGAARWSSDGIAILDRHRGAELARAVPTRLADGSIEVRTPATKELRNAVNSGNRHMSIEFFPLAERRTASGIRELTRAFIDGAALVKSPSYEQTRAELRSRSHKVEVWECLAG